MTFTLLHIGISQWVQNSIIFWSTWPFYFYNVPVFSWQIYETFIFHRNLLKNKNATSETIFFLFEVLSPKLYYIPTNSVVLYTAITKTISVAPYCWDYHFKITIFLLAFWHIKHCNWFKNNNSFVFWQFLRSVEVTWRPWYGPEIEYVHILWKNPCNKKKVSFLAS